MRIFLNLSRAAYVAYLPARVQPSHHNGPDGADIPADVVPKPSRNRLVVNQVVNFVPDRELKHPRTMWTLTTMIGEDHTLQRLRLGWCEDARSAK